MRLRNTIRPTVPSGVFALPCARGLWRRVSVHRRLCFETAADGSTNRLDRFTYDNYLQIANCNLQHATGNLQLFVWDPTEPVATRPLVFYQPNALPQLYAHDGNKNISELISADDGTISAHYKYSTFGEVILSSGDFALSNPFRFSSEYTDDALGLVYYNYRHYEPVTGRWLQRDGIEEAWRGVNSFCFTVNNPISFLDKIGFSVYIYNPPFDLKGAISKFEDWYKKEKRRLDERDDNGENWVDRLPSCPTKLSMENGEFVSPNSDEWEMSGFLSKLTMLRFHPGGKYELRTRDPSKYGGSGNQCVYDECGNLLTEVPVAGTADFTSPNGGGFWGHQKNDVAPFNLARRIDSYIGDGSNEYVKKYYEVRPSK